MSENTFELAKRVSSTTNDALILSIIPCRYKLVDKVSKVNIFVDNFFKVDATIKFKREKFLDAREHIAKDSTHLKNYPIVLPKL